MIDDALRCHEDRRGDDRFKSDRDEMRPLHAGLDFPLQVSHCGWRHGAV